MAEQVDTPTRTFTAGAALAQFLRVNLSSGKLAAAGLGAVELGTITTEAFADLDIRAVELNTKQGTVKMVAAAASTLGAAVYGAAAGKVSSTVNGHLIGTALQRVPRIHRGPRVLVDEIDDPVAVQIQ